MALVDRNKRWEEGKRKLIWLLPLGGGRKRKAHKKESPTKVGHEADWGERGGKREDFDKTFVRFGRRFGIGFLSTALMISS